MRCNYCDRDADTVVEKDGVKVGLCDEHFRERLEELADSEAMEELGERLDVDRD